MTGIKIKEKLEKLPKEWMASLIPKIREFQKSRPRKIIVLDDDPTGTQTVFNVPVLLDWSYPWILREFKDPSSCFFISTNSRSLSGAQSRLLHQAICRHVTKASRQTGVPFTFVSRSDSTLRGHFPLETETIKKTLGLTKAITVIVPFFKEGNRLTLQDIHYLVQGGRAIPVAKTAFARDPDFPFSQSNLRRWIQEKTKGKTTAGQVRSISIRSLRRGGPKKVLNILTGTPWGGFCVVNCLSQKDMEVFVLGALMAEQAGIKIIYRSAASFVQTRLGMRKGRVFQPCQKKASQKNGGLILVGSFVPKTTSQLKTLLRQPGISGQELNVDALAKKNTAASEVRKVVRTVNRHLSRKKNLVVYTSRTLHSRENPKQRKKIQEKISNAFTQIVHALKRKPDFLIAKGGITSFEVASNGLKGKRAVVLGQILPGIPVWDLGSHAKFKNFPLVIFPGNVGGPRDLARVIEKF